jgi:hypothetical protein
MSSLVAIGSVALALLCTERGDMMLFDASRFFLTLRRLIPPFQTYLRYCYSMLSVCQMFDLLDAVRFFSVYSVGRILTSCKLTVSMKMICVKVLNLIT